MTTALLIVHGVVAVALLGALTHQVLATWLPARTRPGSFLGRFRAVPAERFAGAVALLYGLSAIMGAILYLFFRVDIRPVLEYSRHWSTLGLFEIKEHLVAIGLALLPAYCASWRQPAGGALARTRAALTLILAFIVWWSFLVGHVVNNTRGFAS